MDKRPIGIFDSGVGGITVLSKIKKELPTENIVYLGDTLNFPYGDKSKEEIIEFSKRNVIRLIQEGVKIIVIACGTATSQAIDVLRREFDIPIIGIINPTVDYIQSKNIEKIGVIATKGTIRSKAWEKALKEKMPNIQVVNKDCPMLATIAEEGRAMGEEGKKAIKEYMVPFKQNEIDKIILGCTHYPIYEKLIKQEFNQKVELINTGVTVANYLKKFLLEHKLQNMGEKDTEKIILTKPEEYFEKIAKNILNSEN